jgi:hypothetical protein
VPALSDWYRDNCQPICARRRSSPSSRSRSTLPMPHARPVQTARQSQSGRSGRLNRLPSRRRDRSAGGDARRRDEPQQGARREGRPQNSPAPVRIRGQSLALTTTVTANRVLLGAHRRASPHEIRLALMIAVPSASAVKLICSGVQPSPGRSGQSGGLASTTAGPICRSRSIRCRPTRPLSMSASIDRSPGSECAQRPAAPSGRQDQGSRAFALVDRAPLRNRIVDLLLTMNAADRLGDRCGNDLGSDLGNHARFRAQ